jgi:hypothetical protein
MAVNRLLCASPKIQVDAAFQGAREAPAVPNPCPNGTELVGLNTRAEEPKPSSEATSRDLAGPGANAPPTSGELDTKWAAASWAAHSRRSQGAVRIAGSKPSSRKRWTEGYVALPTDGDDRRVSRGRTPRLCGQPTPRPRESLPLPRLALKVDWTALELVSKWRR